ncbi:MAG: hypothetical protein CSA05_02180 [Bacteroidia bacterium]|nr:MAG: hypothetical protein CSA05_02180 [Bacteroidia bacterium]
MTDSKYFIQCKECNHKINNFKSWFEVKQACPECGSHQADVVYYRDMADLKKLIRDKSFQPNSLWGYFDFLPLEDRKNIVSIGSEGIKPIDRWTFLEDFAKRKYNIHIKVYAHRHDFNHATGTFKDLAGTVVASVLKENKIKNFVGASTGNIGVAYSRYLAHAGINLYLFLPEISVKSQEAEIAAFGQNVFRTNGDYAYAKKMAKDFAEKHNFLLTAGNFCPMRLEAKKTMVYEWLRLLPEFPTVFMQAISGGSGPIGVVKACKELEKQGMFEKMPRLILPQPNACAPMAEAWTKAKAENFPKGWERDYPVYENPQTSIQTLSTGNPTAYPAMATMVRESNGEIISSDEEKAADIARLISYKTSWRIGPAAAITMVGFFQALREKTIKDGDVVMLNIGEGTGREPDFKEKTAFPMRNLTNIDEIELTDIDKHEEELWKAVENV